MLRKHIITRIMDIIAFGDLGDTADMVHAFPTWNEAIKYAAAKVK